MKISLDENKKLCSFNELSFVENSRTFDRDFIPHRAKKVIKKVPVFFRQSLPYRGNKPTFSNEKDRWVKVRKTFLRNIEISVRKENFWNIRFKGKSLNWCLVISSNVDHGRMSTISNCLLSTSSTEDTGHKRKQCFSTCFTALTPVWNHWNNG